MQNNPSGFGSSGNQPPPNNPFASPSTRPFSFASATSPQTQQQRTPFPNNPFQKVNKAPTTLFGMNINPQTTTIGPAFGAPKPVFSFSNPVATNRSIPSASDSRSQFRFSREVFKFQTPPAQQTPPAGGSKEDGTTEAKPVVTEEPVQSHLDKNEPIFQHELPDCDRKDESEGLQEETTPTGKKQLKRTASTDVSDLRTIVVHLIPEDSNNKLELTKHFQAFGNITRIFPNTKKGTATITFDCHDSAAKAKKGGSQLHPGVELKILWKQAPSKERKAPVASKGVMKEKLARSIEDSQKKAASVPKKTNATSINLSEGLPMQMTEEELKNVLLLQARTVAEKATILDARDRLVRLNKENKNRTASDVKSVATLKGTCPDMCPEKERYLRVEKRRLAQYEMVDHDKEYEVNHRLAVKEYSRSSADQAEPLAHELRPLPVLEMTMDYLIASIMERCDSPSENLGEWYNFLWDRTRGIRKDITQQSLCDLGAVSLVEKCARFHIHCTARLCELDMQDFDQKINDENLTKCMQTLKHMYYDLSVKQIFCPSEAEFRAYDILLHLNVGDTLREVQQYREEVRESSKVRAALQFFNALNSRNFVRFFRLAKNNSDYLTCCLLQRYFQQMRNSALQIMVHAFGPPKKAQVPLSNVIDLLGFEDQEEADTWCQCHGLAVDVDKDILHLERLSFIQMPESFPPKRRSFRLIESKRKCPISQVIASGRVDSQAALSHQPHLSFDDHGHLAKEAWLAEDQSESAPQLPAPTVHPGHSAPPPPYEPPKAAPPPPYVVSQPKPAPPPNYVLMQRLAMELFQETCSIVINNQVIESAQQVMRQVQFVKLSSRLREQVLEEFVRESCGEVVREVIAEIEAEKRRITQRRLELERKRQIWSLEICNGVINEVVHDLVKSSGSETIRIAKELKAATLREELSLRMLTSVIDDVINSQCRTLSTDVAQETIALRESLIKEARRMVLNRRVGHCFERWRRFAQWKIKRRTEKQTFPAGASLLTYNQQVLALTSKGESRPAASVKRKSVLDLALNAKRLNALSDLHLNISNMEAELDKPINLFSVLESTLRRTLHNSKVHCWKLTILSLINGKSSGIGELIRRWLGLQSVKPITSGWIYTETKDHKRHLTLSITYTDDIHHCVTEGMRGANALLIVVNTHVDEHLQRQLQNLLDILSTEFKYFSPSVAVMDGNCEISRSVDVGIAITKLEPCCQLCLDFNNPPPDRSLKLSRFLVAVVESTKSLWPTGLQTSALWDLAHEFLLTKLFPSIYCDLHSRLSRGILHKPLSIIVDYHNHTIEQLGAALIDPDLCRIQWPPLELAGMKELNFPPADWNAAHYQQSMFNKLRKYLLLPTWSDKEYDFSDACLALREYCLKVALPGLNESCLLSRLNAILEACKCRFRENLPEAVPQAENIPWTDIYQACIDYRLQALQVEDGTKDVIGYFTGVFDKIQGSRSWINASGWVAMSEAVTLRDSLERSQVELQSRRIYSAPEGVEAVLPTRDVPEEIAVLCDKIADKQRQAKEENERFEAMLNRALSPAEAVARPMSKRLNSPSARKSLRNSSASSSSGLVDHLELVEQTLSRSKREGRMFETYLLRQLED